MKSIVVLLCVSIYFSSSLADKRKCNTLGLNFYRVIGCKESGTFHGCPSYEGCEYSQPIGHCLYQGQKIEQGQSVEDVVKDSSCSFGCFCAAADDEKGRFICAEGECGIYDENLVGKTNCFLRYTLDSCCPESEPVCGDSEPATCSVGGRNYKEGQRFSPPDQCVTCICTKDFDGKFDGPNCRLTSCDVEVRHANEIEANCAPLYFGNATDALCCPVGFVCPSNIDVIKESDASSDKVCRYGLKTLKLGSTIETENNSFGKRKVSCECVAPPLMTCRMTYN